MKKIINYYVFPIAFTFFFACSSLSTDQAKELQETKMYLDSLRAYLTLNVQNGTESGKSSNSIARDDRFRLELRRLAARVDSLSGVIDGMVPKNVVRALIRDAIKTMEHGNVNIGSTNIPEHEWIGTSLRFKNPNGRWGELVDIGSSSQRMENISGKSNITQNFPDMGPVMTFSMTQSALVGMSKEQQNKPGLVVATIHAGRNGRGIISGFSKGIRVKASVHWKDFGENENSFVTDNSFVMPVCAGTGWNVTPVQWQGSVEATVYWLPFQ